MNTRTEQPESADPQQVDAVETLVLAVLFDHALDVAFFVQDASGRYLAVNQSLVERHGLQHKADVIGKRPSNIGLGKFQRIPAEQDKKILETGEQLT